MSLRSILECSIPDEPGYQATKAVRPLDEPAPDYAQPAHVLDPEIVILDVNMPGMTGPAALERILAMRPWQCVLMASGYGDEAMLRAMHDRRNVLAIQKPFTIDDLEAKLDALRS